jgi:hypothetical protein
VVVAAPGFAPLVGLIGRNQGIPILQAAVYPGAFALHSDAELVDNTTQTVFTQIVDLLTRPIKAETKKGVETASPEHVVFTGTLDEVNRFFLNRKWSDGMPVIPPTVNRVEEFLNYTDLSPHQEIAILPSANLRATSWNIAVNGVMAGCQPEHLPLLIAMVRAMGEPASRLTSWGGSTHSFISFLCVNGPLARQLGIDHGQGLIAYPTNQVIGRALGLIERNIAGFRIKETQMGSFGKTQSWVLAEDEQALFEIGWEPFHVEKGFDKNVSAVSVGSSTIWGQNLIPATSDARIIMQLMAYGITYKECFASGNIGSSRTELMTPSVAKVLAGGGYTRKSLKEDLIKTARKVTYEWAFSKVYGTFGKVYPSFEEELANCLAEPAAEKAKLPPWFPRFPGWEEIQTTPSTREGNIELLVCGDPSRNKAQTLAGSGLVTREIKLPANWDSLMKERRYRPLNSYYL